MLVRDLVDISDPMINEMADVVREQGSRPILRGGGSNAVGDVVPSLVGSGVAPGSLFLLRFHGHGNRGVQVIGYGTGCHIYYNVLHGREMPSFEECIAARDSVSAQEGQVVGLAMSRSNISLASLELADVSRALLPMRRYLSPYGSIEFHGCQVAGGTRGARFLQHAANLMHAPCTGPRTRQHTYNAIRFSGPLLTKFPRRGSSLRRWARDLPALTSNRPTVLR